MSSNFTRAQRDFLNNVKQAVALLDREIQRIREQRMAICMSGFELDWQLLSVSATQSDPAANKLGSLINAHTDFQTALKEIYGTQSQAFVNESDNISNPGNLPKPSANGNDPASLIVGTGTPGRSSGSGRSVVGGSDSTATRSRVVSPGAN
jgi:hypothetical protein